MGGMARAIAGTVAGLGLVAGCNNPRAPELKEERPVEVNPDVLRQESREAGRATGNAERAGDRAAPEGG